MIRWKDSVWILYDSVNPGLRDILISATEPKQRILHCFSNTTWKHLKCIFKDSTPCKCYNQFATWWTWRHITRRNYMRGILEQLIPANSKHWSTSLTHAEKIWSNKGYMSPGYLISRPLALHLIKTSYFIGPLYVTFFCLGTRFHQKICCHSAYSFLTHR